MATQPNILVFMTDQQRWDSLGCYGVPGVHTPNLDRLAGQGVRYDACYVNNPICSPSRASFWTGKHLPGHGCFNNQDCLPLEEVSFAERLATAGYDTALIGKLHLQQQHREAEHRHPRDGFRVYEWCMAPFTHFAPVNAYQSWLADRDPAYLARLSEDRAMVGDTPVSAHQTTWAAERCNEFLTAGRDRSKPFFLCCSVFDPHNPYWNHPSEIEQLLDIDRLPAPVAADESFDQRTDALQRYGVHGYMHDYLRRYVAKYGAAPYPEIMRRWRTGYHAAVALDRSADRSGARLPRRVGVGARYHRGIHQRPRRHDRRPWHLGEGAVLLRGLRAGAAHHPPPGHGGGSVGGRVRRRTLPVA